MWLNCFLSFKQAGNAAVTIDNLGIVQERSEKGLFCATANQPVVASVDADGSDFQHYAGVSLINIY